MLHAWLTRGLVTASDIAKWRFDGDESKVEELMKHTPHAMNDLLSLEEVPNVGDDEQNKKRVALAEQARITLSLVCLGYGIFFKQCPARTIAGLDEDPFG